MLGLVAVTFRYSEVVVLPHNVYFNVVLACPKRDPKMAGDVFDLIGDQPGVLCDRLACLWLYLFNISDSKYGRVFLMDDSNQF
jgi:hypothetical protein